MRILVYAADAEERKFAAFVKKAFAPGSVPGLELEVLPFSSFARNYRKKAPGAFVYLDAVAEPDAGRLLEAALRLKAAEGSAWGVIDRAGMIEDPSAVFFAGGKDYIGPRLFKAGVGPERLRQALAFAGMAPRQEARVEAAPFPGWEGLAVGEEVAVRFCYAAVGNQRELLERIGEKRLNKLKEDFAAFLDTWAKECGGIEWIRDQSGNLILFPPRDEGMNPTLAAFRLILDRALIGYEVFRLETPLTFRFAFHSGTTMWRPPGATGTIVSDDVNFIFHLGTKAAEDGVILVSDEAERFIHPSLRDLFAPGGDFEGRALLASKRFKD